VPAFDTYSVDLVINGHNHIYERTYPIRGGSTVSTNVPIGGSWNSANGTTYITAGGAGKSLYSFSAEDFYDGNEPSGAPTSVPTYINEYDPTTQATSTTSENVTWSATRYTGYCLLVVDSLPGSFGGTSTPPLYIGRLPGAARLGCRTWAAVRSVVISTSSVGLPFERPPPIRSLSPVVSSPDESSSLLL